MKKAWPLLLIALLAVYAAASPLVTYYQMRAAVQQRDAEALAEYIDFPAVRQDLKDQLNAETGSRIADQADNDTLAVLGGLFASVVVDKAVDAFVTPAGLAELMKGDIPKTGSAKRERTGDKEQERADEVRFRYLSWDKFAVIVPHGSGREIRFILRRRGLGWKLTAIKLPLGD